MDTSSHIMMGAGLAAISSLDPVVASSLPTREIILFTSIAASVIPDLDVVLKVAGNNVYINNHRGISHSIFFVLIWTIALTSIAYLVKPQIDVGAIMRWNLIAVSLHIYTDILNGYGTQFLWPFYKKWISYGITYTFDLFIIISHLISFGIAFILKIPVGKVFLVTYSILLVYILMQIAHHYFLSVLLEKKYDQPKRIVLISRSLPHTWKYVIESKNGYFAIGQIVGKNIEETDRIDQFSRLSEDLWKIVKHDKNIRAFLNFSPIYNWRIEQIDDNVLEVRVFDLRYQKIDKNNNLIYTFNAICHINQGVITDSYMGFVFNEERLQKLLRKDMRIKDYIKILKTPS